MASFSYVALKATNGDAPFKYLGVTIDGYLDYSIDEVLNPKAKFAVEYAPGRHNLVHIRSCSNNKYWARSSNHKWNADENWIAAKATGKVEDQSAWNCTLFRVDLIEGEKKAKFYHVQSGRTVCIPNYDWSRKMFLCIDPTATTEAISMIFDFDKIVVLPKLVAFKDHNDRFYTNGDGKLPHFDFKELGDPNVVCEILTTRDGHIRIKAQRIKRFWKRVTEWPNILMGADVEFEENNLDQMFEVIKVEKNIVALRNLGNKLICRSFKLFGVDVLAAFGESITKEAKLEVKEPLDSRTVKVLEFDIRNAKIYDDVAPLAVVTQTVNNTSTNLTQQENLELKISTTETITWSNSVSLSLGVKTTFETGIPLIIKGGVEVTAAASYEHQWQESIEEKVEIGSVYTIQVPPMTTAVGTAVASKGSCEVPFSYVQIDHLKNGETIKTTLYDGVFTGVNSYNFNHSVEYIPYKPPLALPAI